MQNHTETQSTDSQVVTPLYPGGADARLAKDGFRLALLRCVLTYMRENKVDTLNIRKFLKWCRTSDHYMVEVASDAYAEAYSNSLYRFYSYADRTRNWLRTLPGILPAYSEYRLNPAILQNKGYWIY